MSNIIHVQFLFRKENQHHYFSSVESIYTVFNEDDIGAKASYLRKCLCKSSLHMTKKAIVRKGVLIRKKQEK